MGAIHFLGPQPVDLTSSRQVVHAGVALAASGASQVYSGFGQSVLIVTMRVNGSVTGTAPLLDLSVEEMDPGDLANIVQTVAASSSISATGQTRTVRIHLKYGDAVRVRWVIFGTTPTFNTVFTTLVASNGAHPTTVGQLTAAESLSVVLASDHGVMPFETEVQADFHTGGTTQNLSLIGLALPSASGAQVAGIVGNPLFTRVTDGTNTMPTADVAARAQFVRVTDGVNAMPTGDVAARAQFVRPTDGSNSAVFKGGSTAAAAADSSMVVALSPNSPLPAGGNTVGSFGLATWIGSALPTVGQKAMASSLPVAIANDQFAEVASGTFTAVSSELRISNLAGKRSIAFQLRQGSSLVGTLSAQVTFDGTNWITTNFVTMGTYARSTTITCNAAGGSQYYYVEMVPGAIWARAILTAWTSGASAASRLNASDAIEPWRLVTDGLYPVSVKGPSTAPVAADTAMVVAMSPNSSIALGSWLGGSTAPTVGQKAMSASIPVVLPNDYFAVKAASTPAVRADQALVVALSPNSFIRGAGLAFAALNHEISLEVAGQLSAAFHLGNSSMTCTFVAEVSVDLLASSTPWFATQFVDLLTGVRSSSLSFAGVTGNVYKGIVLPPGTTNVRVRISAYTSGSGNGYLFVSGVPGVAESNIQGWLGSTAPTVGQKTMANSIPVVLPSDQTAVSVASTLAPTGTPSTVTLSGASQTALVANANRRGATLFNDSLDVVHVAEFTPVSATSFTTRLAIGGEYKTSDYRGIITVIGAGAGAVRVTERT